MNPFTPDNKKKKFLVTYEFELKENNQMPRDALSKDTVYLTADRGFQDGASFLKFVKEEVAFKVFKTKDISRFKYFVILWTQYD